MNWLLIGVIFTLTLSTSRNKSAFDRIISTKGTVDASPIPPNAPFLKPINPYIKHWEAAHFDAKIIAAARHQHEINRRRKRYANNTVHSHGTPPLNTIKFQFYAHNREFRVVLQEDPSSIFAPNVHIESTVGPIHYDVSRIYSGMLEDHDDSIVHGILTENNLFDGSIITPTENYYIEPASRYSNELADNGIHTIVYKTSDVHMSPHQMQQKATTVDNHEPAKPFSNCASQRLYEKMMNQRRQQHDETDSNKNTLNRYASNEILSRNKRWLADEMIESRDPPLPLDLDAPYNDEYTVLSRKYNKDIIQTSAKTDEPWRNILITNYNAKNDYASRNLSAKHPTNGTGAENGSSSSNTNGSDRSHFGDSIRMLNGTYTSSKPSHKTHVEIITKNGATRKPNIIGSNYNPEVILTRNNFHHHQQQHHHSNINSNFHMNSIDAKSTYDRKSTCMLYLQADHTFYEKMGSEEASIEAITRHVQRANTIYKNTDFNGDGKADNITFMIKRIKIHTSNALKDTNYRFPGNYGVEKFLELFSEEDYDAFCLAYMFTYRDFEMGTLGLAWTGDLKNAGGVCEKNGHYRGSLKSLNTGIVTLLNYGKHVPPAVSHVTLAHEIGHNFGSPHDPEMCTPGGEDGNYIMFARATSGDKKNNNKFSPCSLRAIEPVLNSKARSSKGCFTEPQQAICGNGVVDPGEECDCGWEEDCKDSCCYPMATNPSLDEKPCTLTPKAYCSPSQGPCCTNTCTLKFGDKCRDDNGCRDPSFCNGQTAHCPPSINKPNKTICNKEFVCFMGECTGSICLAYGLESCQCIPTDNDPKTKACELCCKLPGEGNPCKSSFEWNDKPYDVPDMYSKPGTPCNDYNGYCDVFQKCREVDPAGPLATLRRLLLSEESIESFKKWVISNWFIVSLIISGIISLLILSTRLFGKEINRKSKSVTIIHSATTETVRLPDDSNGVIVHAAIRTKVPLKKKVRGERSKTKRSATNAAAAAAAAIVTATTKTGDGNAFDKVAIPNTSNSKSTNLKRSIAKQTKKIKQSRKSSHGVQHLDASKSAKNPLASTMAKVKSSRTKVKSTSSKAKDTVAKQHQANRLSVDEDKLNAFGKVQQWLLESPTTAPQSANITTATTTAAAALQELDQLDNNKANNRQLSKSQSQTHNLTGATQRNASPKKVKSLSNLQEKVKLQVVYKPPFKLSLKLSSNSAVQTRVASSGEATRNRRAARSDKNRKLSGLVENRKKPRTALLLQSKSGGRDDVDHGFRLVKSANHRRTEDRQQLMPASERKQDTLELKAERSAMMNDEKVGNHHMLFVEPSTSINTDTFKISKTSSGTKLLSNSINALNEIDNPPSLRIGNEYSKPNAHGGSFINNFRHSIAAAAAATSDQPTNFAPTGRSPSTSNLTKDLNKITRSSTTNLSKAHSHRNSFDVKQNPHNVARSNSTHNFSRDRHNDAHTNSNLMKHTAAHVPRISSRITTLDKLSNSENGTLPSSAISSTSSTNTNASMNSANMKESQ